jgi:hypothetical protein
VARRQVFMNEIVEMIYQWHQGAGVKGISHSLRFDRDTVRKYVRMAQKVGIERKYSQQQSFVNSRSTLALV